MEPITLTATTVATLILSKALEESGTKLGTAVSDKIGKLLNLIREKFKDKEMEEKLTKAQEEPNEKNKSRFERELVEQMKDDEEFANKLKTMIDEIELERKANTSFFKDMNIKGIAKLGNINLKSKAGNMEAVSNSRIDGDLTMGDVNMTNQ